MSSTALAAVLVTLGNFAAGSASAGAGAACCDGIQLHGYLSTSFHYNMNRPDSRTSQFRVFDAEEGDFQIDVAEIALEKPLAGPGTAGFRFHLTAGGAVPSVAASSGLFRDADGSGQDIDFHMALVSYVLPIGNGLQLDVGKHVTHLGYEVIEGYDGQNDHATHSFLFGYAIPFTQAGLRMGYTFTPTVSAAFYLVSGWDVVRDNNGAKTIGGQLALGPISGVSGILNYIGGPEQAGNDDDRRQVVDAIVTFRPSDRLLLGVNGDYGTEESVVGPSGEDDATWSGAAVYARAGLTPWLALSGRFERFDDADGARTGVKQTLTGVTITPEVRLAEGFVMRADVRFDASDEGVFEKEDTPAGTDGQATVSLNATYSF